jgi:hypothetical protein
MRISTAAKCVAPLIISILLTPVCLVIAIWSAGAGHGDNYWGYILFPYSMLLIRGAGRLTTEPIALALLQLPFYGLAVGITWVSGKGRWWVVIFVIGVAHIAAAYLCFPH